MSSATWYVCALSMRTRRLFALAVLLSASALPFGCGTTTTTVGRAEGDASSTLDGSSALDGSGRCCSTTAAGTGCRGLGGVNSGPSACKEVCNPGGTYNWKQVDQDGCPAWTYDVRPSSFVCGDVNCVSTPTAPTYCHAEVSKNAGVKTLYTCRAVPGACLTDQSCACIAKVDQAVITTCQDTGGVANSILEVP
ncbi:MAG: hypothetical protein U0174_11025 [Polyangiaceae bacterium]